MITSMMNINFMGVMFTNHLEHSIYICKDEYLGQARPIVFVDKVHKMKEFIDCADLIYLGATT